MRRPTDVVPYLGIVFNVEADQGRVAHQNVFARPLGLVSSRSPSCFSVQGIGGHHDSDGGIYSQIVTTGDVCLCAEEDPYPADLIDQNTAKPENIPVKTNKPRITLRVRPPKPGPQPKVLLRLSQPKKAPAQRSVRQGIKNRRR